MQSRLHDPNPQMQQRCLMIPDTSKIQVHVSLANSEWWPYRPLFLRFRVLPRYVPHRSIQQSAQHSFLFHSFLALRNLSTSSPLLRASCSSSSYISFSSLMTFRAIGEPPELPDFSRVLSDPFLSVLCDDVDLAVLGADAFTLPVGGLARSASSICLNLFTESERFALVTCVWTTLHYTALVTFILACLHCFGWNSLIERECVRTH